MKGGSSHCPRRGHCRAAQRDGEPPENPIVRLVIIGLLLAVVNNESSELTGEETELCMNVRSLAPSLDLVSGYVPSLFEGDIPGDVSKLIGKRRKTSATNLVFI